jgi:hypothetical protein
MSRDEFLYPNALTGSLTSMLVVFSLATIVSECLLLVFNAQRTSPYQITRSDRFLRFVEIHELFTCLWI